LKSPALATFAPTRSTSGPVMKKPRLPIEASESSLTTPPSGRPKITYAP
jgi:hypothetical protein